MQTLARCVGLFSVLATVSCATSSATSGDEAHTPQVQPSRASDVVLEKELRESSALTALEFVRERRPQWLSRRGASLGGSPPEPVVYLAHARIGGLQALGQLPTANIRELRYFNATEATSRWGTGPLAGAIVVSQ
jgi:hypothetical protein